MSNSYIEWMHMDDFGEIGNARYVALWDTRADRIITAPPITGIMDFHDSYMQRYHRII